jgi:hypothetical protein
MPSAMVVSQALSAAPGLKPHASAPLKNGQKSTPQKMLNRRVSFCLGETMNFRTGIQSAAGLLRRKIAGFASLPELGQQAAPSACRIFYTVHQNCVWETSESRGLMSILNINIFYCVVFIQIIRIHIFIQTFMLIAFLIYKR